MTMSRSSLQLLMLPIFLLPRIPQVSNFFDDPNWLYTCTPYIRPSSTPLASSRLYTDLFSTHHSAWFAWSSAISSTSCRSYTPSSRLSLRLHVHGHLQYPVHDSFQLVPVIYCTQDVHLHSLHVTSVILLHFLLFISATVPTFLRVPYFGYSIHRWNL